MSICGFGLLSSECLLVDSCKFILSDGWWQTKALTDISTPRSTCIVAIFRVHSLYASKASFESKRIGMYLVCLTMNNNLTTLLPPRPHI